MNRPDAMRPGRILYVVSLFPSWSETFIVREIEQLIELGVDIRILTLKHPCQDLVHDSAAELMPRLIRPLPVWRGVPAAIRAFAGRPGEVLRCVAALVAGMWRQPVALAKTLVALFRTLGVLPAIQAFRCDLVHAHWATYPSSMAWCLGRLLGIPFSFTSHAHDIFVEDHMLERKLVDAALAVTISRFNVGFLAARHDEAVRGARLEVVHCGVDRRRLPGHSSSSRRQPGLVASVGRLAPIKGFEVLTQALAFLQRDSMPFHCVVIGEGPLRESLERLREQSGLGARLELPGARPQSEVRALIARASVFVMPSVVTPAGDRDGIPVALMEAMAGGAAVVSTRVSGIPELVQDGVTGLLVEPGDARALAAAIQRLLDDPELRARLGAAAREHVFAHFEVAGQTRRLFAHFSQALLERSTADVG